MQRAVGRRSAPGRALGPCILSWPRRCCSWQLGVSPRVYRRASRAASSDRDLQGASGSTAASSNATAFRVVGAATVGPGLAREQAAATDAAAAVAADGNISPASNSASSSAAGSAAGARTFSAALLRRLAAANTVLDVAEALSEEASPVFTEEDARSLLGFCLQRGKVALALAVYQEMTQARRPGRSGVSASRSLDAASAWPAASLAITTELVLGLCQQLCIVEAMQVLADIKVAGMPRGSEEVGFGKVITSPLAPDRPLTVVQPQEGAKTVADGYSRYEFDVFSGTAVSCSSTALLPPSNPLLGLGRALGLLRKPPVAAIHEFVLQAPDGTSRTFRVGTETSAVPAQVGERVTVVSAPARNVRKGGLFNASPPGAKPGEALSATNHKTGVVLPLLRPPVSAEQAGVPGWVLPLAVVLAGGDAASSLLDPSLPLLLAAGATSLAGGAVLGSSVLMPRLKQLPDAKVRVEYVRQQLLGQYSALAAKAGAALGESAEDVRFLARLWQLQNKMEAVSSAPMPAAAAAAAGGVLGGATGAGAGSIASSSGTSTASSSSTSTQAAAGLGSGGAAYEARIGRVARARANIEERLSRRIALLDGYSRVMNMIEIEVEMDIEVPAAEVAGIQEQLAWLVELEGLQEDWRAQAEARDEVERLLRAA